MVKGDYVDGFSVSFDALNNYWKYLIYGLIFNMIILKHTNPLFKIIFATYVGIESIIGIAYAPIVYYKSEGNDNTQNTGILPRITGFIPNILYRVSLIVVKLLLKLMRQSNNSRQIDLESCASTMTYCFIYFRKIVALACGILITHEDDESSHIKALTIYALCCWIQMKFIGNIDTNLKPKISKDTDVSFFRSLINVLRLNKSHDKRLSFNSLKKLRVTIFYITAFIVISFVYYTYYHVSESLDTKPLWTLILKCIILTDSIFTCSFLVELSGLNLVILSMKNTVV